MANSIDTVATSAGPGPAGVPRPPTGLPQPPAGLPRPRAARRGRRLPWLLTGLSVAVAALLLVPLCFLLIQANQAGWSSIAGLMFRHLTWVLLRNTVELTVIVTLCCAVLGTGAAYCVERVALPGRRLWAVLLVLPVALPDFVVGYAWSSWVPFAHGLTGAVTVMSLSLYPLVYLPVAAALRAGDAALEEQARSLGRGPLRAFAQVTLRQIRPALLGGCLLVALALLAEYGAFEILRFQTFTTEIFTEYLESFDGPAACALSLILVVLSLAVLLAEYAAGGGGRVARQVAVRALRRARPGVLGGLAISLALTALSSAALLLPVGTLAYWCVVGGSTTLPPASLLGAAGQTALYAVSAAALTTALALPVGLLGAAPQPVHGAAGAQHLPGPGPAGAGDRAGTGVLRDPLRLLAVPEPAVAGDRLRGDVLPAGPGRGARLGGLRARRAGGDRPFARAAALVGGAAGDPAAGRAGAGGRLLPGLPLRGHRTDRDPDPDPDRRAHPGHPVLGVRVRPLLRRRGPLRGADGGDRRRAQLRPRPLVRPGQSPTGAIRMTSLTLSGVAKSYGRQPVLHGVDLEVPAGALAAVLGPSGSGKTTLLRVVAGFERADAGTVSLGGQVVDDGRRQLPPERRKIGYVPQDGGLFPHLTVAGNVAFGLPGRARRHTAAVGELLERVGLTGLDGRYPHQLSGGQQQRVALARALAVRPQLVLLDEPFSALDAGLRASIRADVQTILREFGATAILVTHDQDEALSMADLVAVVRDGRIAQCATPHELYRRPADPQLASFVGEANLLPGTFEPEGGSGPATVRTVLGSLPLHAAPEGSGSGPPWCCSAPSRSRSVRSPGSTTTTWTWTWPPWSPTAATTVTTPCSAARSTGPTGTRRGSGWRSPRG